MVAPNWVDMRARVKAFVEDRVYPAEDVLDNGAPDAARAKLAELMAAAKAEGLWALGHPVAIGGQGMPLLDYVDVNEVIGRSQHAMVALGTHSLQDALMLDRYAAPEWRAKYLLPLVAGTIFPSFAMTEPDVASSDPTQLQTTATLEGGEWLIRGRKWFTTGAAGAAYTTVMCRTESGDAAPHAAFSMIVVPTDTPGYRIVRDTPVLGLHHGLNGHYEVAYDDVRVPAANLLGPRGQGFAIAQMRLGPGRIFHCMRWLGQAQRAFDLMCRRLNERSAGGEKLADKQLMQQFVFDSAAEIQSARLLTLDAAAKIDAGSDARVEIGLIKVVGAKMLHNVVDRAVQVFGAKGLTPDTPLHIMYRHAREARIYDGPDEVHITSVGKRLLRAYAGNGPGIDFGAAG
ncbi:acyl-CoA dehydrogenase family protein [Polymorphobacter sp. PAMC 29334]|uniref:acyl-CoA dehydrogenase family protein n=1 Tax=Polymorphobacter sp. PAMC 29334 TaxID=2862331 RepID=UPI001C7437B5|nr:acyl-CoA dehydrogenase family protein [Polymorphobacter sp. PAMC 29334]QYE34501.1 acyl-CoA dehydrogenase family protein [Polymorphobacter sp. PAMC 29334]